MYYYAIYTTTGKELEYKNFLQKLAPEFTFFFPRRELYIRRKGVTKKEVAPLYKGYFFLKSKDPIGMEQKNFLEKEFRKHMPESFIKILGEDMENKKVMPLSSAEVNYIEMLTGGNEIIPSMKLLKEGDEYKVETGPLKGQKVQIVRVDKRKKRFVVRAVFLGETREIQLGMDYLSE
ncbi:MAG: hypothetical protein D6767_03905 [Candidatus Hydrogenedentota bacterium]|nr:MAG: hypothetical protein D6767_03905 [Candidatus Hydrogenedentota bacterium]